MALFRNFNEDNKLIYEGKVVSLAEAKQKTPGHSKVITIKSIDTYLIRFGDEVLAAVYIDYSEAELAEGIIDYERYLQISEYLEQAYSIILPDYQELIAEP
jgi:hypothetical protein